MRNITIYIVSREMSNGFDPHYTPIRAFRNKKEATEYIKSQYDSGLYTIDTVVLS